MFNSCVVSKKTNEWILRKKSVTIEVTNRQRDKKTD